jgi:hypothetical protein
MDGDHRLIKSTTTLGEPGLTIQDPDAWCVEIKLLRVVSRPPSYPLQRAGSRKERNVCFC